VDDQRFHARGARGCRGLGVPAEDNPDVVQGQARWNTKYEDGVLLPWRYRALSVCRAWQDAPERANAADRVSVAAHRAAQPEAGRLL